MTGEEKRWNGWRSCTEGRGWEIKTSKGDHLYFSSRDQGASYPLTIPWLVAKIPEKHLGDPDRFPSVPDPFELLRNLWPWGPDDFDRACLEAAKLVLTGREVEA